MKAKQLTIQNIGLIESEAIVLNKPLILFYGDVRQGKTTILNAVRYLFGGSFPDDLIRHGAQSAFVQLDLDCGQIRREFYRAEDGSVKARPVSFIRDGVKVPRPVEELKKFLNPFLLDQDFLIRMNDFERKKFFTELFETATEALDKEAAKCATEAQGLRIKVKAFGDIQPVKAERVNVEELKEQRVRLLAAHAAEVNRVAGVNAGRREHNAQVQDAINTRHAWENEIERLAAALDNARNELTRVEQFLSDNKPLEILAVPAAPDTAALDQQISEAAANNVRAELYEKDKKRLEEKLADEQKVLELERRQRAIRDEKIARLDKISADCGVPGLKFLEDGDFTFEGTTPGMLSTSQLMRLSAALSALYPEGIGIDLVDRGESLGSSIFSFIEKAKREDKTILATIVGERPASVPENVGVFVVEKGKLS